MSKKPRVNKTDSVLGVPGSSTKRRSPPEVQGFRWERPLGESREPVPWTPSGVPPDWCPHLDEKIRNQRQRFSERMGFTPDAVHKLEERMILDAMGDYKMSMSEITGSLFRIFGATFLVILGLSGVAAWMLFHGN